MSIYQLDDDVPLVPDSAFVADSAQVMGHVTLGEDSSVWFGAVLRGDTETITVGAGSNIQDGSVLHADYGQPLVIGERVTVGARCTVLYSAEVGDGVQLGPMTLVMKGERLPAGSRWQGAPAAPWRA